MKKTLKEWRVEKGFTQEYMAKELEMSVGNYNKKENGELKISLIEAKAISDLFDSDIESIFFCHEDC